MTLRETLQKNSTVVKVVVSLLIVICVGVVCLQLRGAHQINASNVGKEFYSDDDGKTWFLDDALKGAPFDHQGKQAYRALVFRCAAGGRPFVAYLGKYSDEQKARWDAEAAKDPAGQTRVAGEAPRDLRKPGESNWQRTPAGMEYPETKCPDGKGNAVQVSPVELDTGATK